MRARKELPPKRDESRRAVITKRIGFAFCEVA